MTAKTKWDKEALQKRKTIKFSKRLHVLDEKQSIASITLPFETVRALKIDKETDLDITIKKTKKPKLEENN